MVSIPGFFGKVPARGDFISRRIPTALRAEWEAWLAGLVVAAREALGDAWPDDWLTAPLWHFILGQGMVPPHGAAGVLMASVDRVGRFFPFCIIGPASRWAADSAALEVWSRSAEALLLSALDDDFDPDRLSGALKELGAPPVSAAQPLETVWTCGGSDRVPAMQLRCSGLPDSKTAAAMITGDFSDCADLRS